MHAMIGVQEHPKFVVRVMVDLLQTMQHVSRGRGAVRGWDDVDLDAREPEEIEILLRCERVVAGDYKQTIVPQARAVPGQGGGAGEG